MPRRDDLLTGRDAGHALFVAESTVRGWVHKGWLAVAGVAHRRNYYRWADLLEAERRSRRGLLDKPAEQAQQ